MVFMKSLCFRCYRKKYKGCSFVTYLKDLEPSEGILSVDCEEPAGYRVIV